jgi:hypothetical protein
MKTTVTHRWSLLLMALLFVPIGLQAQVSDPDDDDPFSDDPLFTRSVRDWFDPDRITQEVRKRRDRIIELSGVDDSYQDLTGYGAVPGFASVSSIRPMVRYNRVEGFVFGIRSDEMDWGRRAMFDTFGQINYAFGRQEWLYTLGAERFFGTGKRFKAGVEYHRITDSDDGFRVGWVENSLTSFFAAYDQMDYFGRRGARVFAVAKPTDWLELNASYRTDYIHNLQRNTRYTMFGHKSTYRLNPAVVPGADTARVSHIVAGFRLNPDGSLQTNRFGISLDVMSQLGKSVPGLPNDFAYDRYDAELRAIAIIDPSAVLKTRLRVGEVVGQPTRNALYALGGVGTVRSEPFKSQTGSAMVLFNAELLIGESGEIFGDWAGGIAEFNLNKLRTMLFFDAGWTGPGPVRDFDPNRMKTTLGVGVNSSPIRFEVAWPTHDLAGTPVFWVRLNPMF